MGWMGLDGMDGMECMGWNVWDGMSIVGYKSSMSTLSNNAREIFAFQMSFVSLIHTKCDDANTRSLLHSGALILNIFSQVLLPKGKI